MKLWVVTKKNAMLVFTLIFAIVTGLLISKGETIAVSGNKRDLPIYCVDKGEEKIASISFDAAWGNGIYGQCDIRH